MHNGEPSPLLVEMSDSLYTVRKSRFFQGLNKGCRRWTGKKDGQACMPQPWKEVGQRIINSDNIKWKKSSELHSRHIGQRGSVQWLLQTSDQLGLHRLRWESWDVGSLKVQTIAINGAPQMPGMRKNKGDETRCCKCTNAVTGYSCNSLGGDLGIMLFVIDCNSFKRMKEILDLESPWL